jgi:hypothetical protein
MARNTISGLPLSSNHLLPPREDEFTVNELMWNISRFAGEYLRGIIDFSYEMSDENYLVKICPLRLGHVFREIAVNADEKYIPVIRAEANSARLKITIENSSSIPPECDQKLTTLANSAGFSIWAEVGGKIIITSRVRSKAPTFVYASDTLRVYNAFFYSFFAKKTDIITPAKDV